MGLIDVSDLLTDPDFVDDMSIIHRTTFVNGYGENQLKERSESTVGSIQPASGQTLKRLPEALRVENVRSFWVKGAIISDGTCAYPDILVFKGSRYSVQMIFDWTNFGEGYAEGVCIREKPSL